MLKLAGFELTQAEDCDKQLLTVDFLVDSVDEALAALRGFANAQPVPIVDAMEMTPKQYAEHLKARKIHLPVEVPEEPKGAFYSTTPPETSAREPVASSTAPAAVTLTVPEVSHAHIPVGVVVEHDQVVKTLTLTITDPAPIASETGTAVPAAIMEAKTFRAVVQYFLDHGVTDAAVLLAGCQKYSAAPAIAKVGDDLQNRIAKALAVMLPEGGATT